MQSLQANQIVFPHLVSIWNVKSTNHPMKSKSKILNKEIYWVNLEWKSQSASNFIFYWQSWLHNITSTPAGTIVLILKWIIQ